MRGNGRHEGRDRIVEANRLDRRPEALRRALDERAVERAGDLQLDRAAGPDRFRLGAELVDGGILAGDDDLAGAVVVCGPDSLDPAAELLDRLVLEPEDRRHRAGVQASSLRHRETTLTHEPDRLARAHCRDRRQRSELADRVTDDEVRLESLGPDRSQDGERRRDQRRLLHLGVDQLVERSVEAELLEIEAGGLTAGAIDVHRSGNGLGELTAHAGLERPLARETECNLAHLGPPRRSRYTTSSFGPHCEVGPHSSSAEPQVRPAPIPVINTSAPSVRRPSAARIGERQRDRARTRCSRTDRRSRPSSPARFRACRPRSR